MRVVACERQLEVGTGPIEYLQPESLLILAALPIIGLLRIGMLKDPGVRVMRPGERNALLVAVTRLGREGKLRQQLIVDRDVDGATKVMARIGTRGCFELVTKLVRWRTRDDVDCAADRVAPEQSALWAFQH